MLELIDALVDADSFLEVHKRWAKELIVGYARLDGRAVGIVANQPKQRGGVLFVDSSDKAARFIWTCNAFGIPLLFLADVPGFMIGTQVERQGIIRAGAKMISAVSEATVPKISVIVRKAYGAGLYAMAGPAFDPDACIALPDAKIAVMGPQAAINAVFYNQLQAIEDPAERERRTEELRAEYKAEIDILHLASELVIDAVVQPERPARRPDPALRGVRLARALLAGEAEPGHARLDSEGWTNPRSASPRYRWAVLAIGAASTAAMAAAQGGLPALGPALQHAFGLTLVQVTGVFTAFGAGTVLTVYAWGALVDRVGERVVLAIGPALGGLALATVVLADSYGALLAGVFVAGLFAAAATGGSGRACSAGSRAASAASRSGCARPRVQLGTAAGSFTLPTVAMAFSLDAALLLLSAGLVLSSVDRRDLAARPARARQRRAAGAARRARPAHLATRDWRARC